MTMLRRDGFDDFVEERMKYYGVDKLPPFPTVDLENCFKNLLNDIGECSKYTFIDIDNKLMCLIMVCTSCLRYLERTQLAPNTEFAGRIAAVIEAYREARHHTKMLCPQSRYLARDRFIKFLPEKTRKAIKRLRAIKSWEDLKKVYISEGGKKLEVEFWKEIFDPHHRPPHFVGENKYKELFAEWQRLIRDDPDFWISFYDFLDTKNNLPEADFEFRYLSRAEREACRLVVQGGLLVRKHGNNVFDTTGWALNNGFREGKKYEDSSQSMSKDHGIWVMSPQGDIYSGPQQGTAKEYDAAADVRRTTKFNMHHSGFLGGAPISGGGEWFVKAGVLKVVTGSSGHYKPNFKQFQDCLRRLAASSIDLDKVAAEWPYNGTLKFFNAKQLSLNEVEAEFNAWPKVNGRPLRPVLPLDPLVLSSEAIPVDGAPFIGTRYLAPPKKKIASVFIANDKARPAPRAGAS